MEKVSKRYAKALFDSLSPDNYLETKSLLTNFAEIFNESKDMTLALLSPSYPLAQRESALESLADRVSNGNKHFVGLLKLLLRNKRLNIVSDVAESFSSLVDRYQKLISLKVETAFPVSEEEQKSALTLIRQSLGNSAEVEWTTNSELIGGARVTAGDLVLDNSIDRSLKEIEQVLKG